MAKFANEQDAKEIASKDGEYIHSKECVNCGSRENDASDCSNCRLDPLKKIKLDGKHSFSIFNYLRTNCSIDLLDNEPRRQHFPGRKLYFALLKEKETIDSNDFTLITGYASEEADYWYGIECFKDKLNLITHLYKNFAGQSKDENDEEDESTWHIVKMFYKGAPIDFRIELTVPIQYFDLSGEKIKPIPL